MKRKTVKMHPEVHRRMKRLKKKTGRSFDSMYDEAGFDFLKRHESKKIQRSNEEE